MNVVMVQQYVIVMPCVKIPQEVIAALVNEDTWVKMVKIVFHKVSFIRINPATKIKLFKRWTNVCNHVQGVESTLIKEFKCKIDQCYSPGVETTLVLRFVNVINHISNHVELILLTYINVCSKQSLTL